MRALKFLAKQRGCAMGAALPVEAKLRALEIRYGALPRVSRLRPVTAEALAWAQQITPEDALGVAALIWNADNQILLVRHHPATGWDTTVWSCPGGAILPHEDIETGLVREVREETGITIWPLRPHKTVEQYFSYGGETIRAYWFVIFEAEYVSGKPRPDHQEVTAVRWFDTPPRNFAFADDYAGLIAARKSLRGDVSKQKRG